MRSRAAVEGGQVWGGGIAAVEVPSVAVTAVHVYGDETPAVYARDIVLLVAISGEKAGLHVRHDPRTLAVAASPCSGGAEICGFHGSRAHSLAVGGRVAIVKTAAAVIVCPVDDVVHALGLIVDGKVAGIVVTVAHARHQVCAIGLPAVYGHRSHVGDGKGVELSLCRTLEGAWRSLVEVVAVAGLVIDHRDVGYRALAEGIVCGGVGISVLRHDAECRAVTLASYLVQRTAVGGRKDACGAVRSHTVISIGFIDVARTLGDFRAGRSHSQKEQGRDETGLHCGHCFDAIYHKS